MANTKTLNDLLKAQGIQSLGELEEIVASSSQSYQVQNFTVLGYKNGDEVNGFTSLDNASALLGGSSRSALTLIGANSPIYPKTNPNTLNVDVSAGIFVTRDSDITVETLTYTGDVIDSDGNGNELTESTVVGQIPVIVSTGTDAASTINETVESLTGITPPTESITIVSLGGGAVDELTATIKEASERKKSLLSEIQSTASSTSVEGLGSSITDTINTVKDEVNSVINDPNLTQSVIGAVSAVEGLADDVAQAAAEAQGSLLDAVDQTLGQVTSAINDGFQDALGDLENAVDELIDDVSSQLNTGFGFAQDLFEDLTGSVGTLFQDIFSSALEITPEVISDVLKDVLAGGDVDLTNATKRLALLDKNLSPEMKAIVESTNADGPKTFETRVVSRAQAAGIPQEQINSFKTTRGNIATALDKVDTTIAGTIVSEVGAFYTEDTDLADLIKRYLGADTQSFAYVDSKEELGLEFYRMTREVSELIVHATETYTNANIGSEEIHLRHQEAGHSKGIQYHYVIRRDGRLQRGMPIDEVSDASNVRGHAQNCIDIALVGGVNVPTDADNPLENLSAQSFTQVQMKTLEAVMEIFYLHQPGGQVFGHNAIDIANEDPYFDVISFVENKFGKKSVYKDLLTEQSLSPKELVSKKPI